MNGFEMLRCGRCFGCQFLQIWKEPMQISPLMGTVWSASVNFTHCHRCLGFAIPTQDMTENLPSWVCRLASGFFYWSGSGRVYHGGFKATGLHLWRKNYTADLPAQAGDPAELLGHEGLERLGTDSNANRLETCIMNLTLPLALTEDTSLQYHFIQHFWIPLRHSLISPKRLSMESRMHPGTQWKWQVEQLEVVWRHGMWWFCFVFLCLLVVFQQIWWSHGISDLSNLFSTSICFGKLFRFIWERARPLMAHLFWWFIQYQLYVVRKTPDGMKNTWLWEPWSRMLFCPSAFLPSNSAIS